MSGMMILAGAGAGLAMMYLMDPDAGARRRRAILHTATSAAGRLRAQAGELGSTVADSVRGTIADAREQATSHVEHHIDRANDLIEDVKHRANLALGRESEHHYLSQTTCALGSMALGMALAWILDPQMGRSRRARLMDKSNHYVHEVADMAGRTGRHLANRVRGRVATGRRYVREHMPHSVDQASATDQPHTAPLM